MIVVAVLGAIGAFLPIAAAATITVYNALHSAKLVREKAAFEQYREVADRQQKQLDAMQVHMGEYQDVVDQLTSEHGDCREDLIGLYGVVQRMHDFARRTADACKRLGNDPGEIPDMPPRPVRPDRQAAELRSRQLQHSTQLLQQASAVIPPAPPLAPSPGGPK